MELLVVNLILGGIAYLSARGLRNGLILGAIGLFFLLYMGAIFVAPDNAHWSLKVSFGLGIGLSFLKGKHIPDKIIALIKKWIHHRRTKSITIDFADLQNTWKFKYNINTQSFSATHKSYEIEPGFITFEDEKKVKSKIETKFAVGRSTGIAWVIGTIFIGGALLLYKQMNLDSTIAITLVVIGVIASIGYDIFEDSKACTESEVEYQKKRFIEYLEEQERHKVEPHAQAAHELHKKEEQERHERQLEIEREKTKRAEIAARQRQQQMERERPAKVDALDDLLTKLDDI